MTGAAVEKMWLNLSELMIQCKNISDIKISAYVFALVILTGLIGSFEILEHIG